MTDVKITKCPSTTDRSLPVFAEVDRLMDSIRNRAYELFEGRGYGAGLALDDWLAAERDFCWPAAEFKETESAFKLEVALAGFEPAEVEVTATPTELIVRAKHAVERKPEGMGGAEQTRWSEFRRNEVYRRVELPAAVEVGKITATMKNGLLIISAPKAEPSSPKVVPVKQAA
jgi:HSP20 family protein